MAFVLRGAIASGLRIRLAHVGPMLRFAVVVGSSEVIDARFRVHPDDGIGRAMSARLLVGRKRIPTSPVKPKPSAYLRSGARRARSRRALFFYVALDLGMNLPPIRVENAHADGARGQSASTISSIAPATSRTWALHSRMTFAERSRNWIRYRTLSGPLSRRRFTRNQGRPSSQPCNRPRPFALRELRDPPRVSPKGTIPALATSWRREARDPLARRERNRPADRRRPCMF